MRHRHLHNATCSLKEYLAYQSVQHTETEDEPLFPSQPTQPKEEPLLQIEIDVGDGRCEVIEVRMGTDVRAEAGRFCEKYGLGEEVERLLVESMEQQIAREINRTEMEQVEEEQEQMREIYANTQTREVLLKDDDEDEPVSYKASSNKKGTGRVLSAFNAKNKRKSLPQNVLQNNKQNKKVINKTSQQICARRGKENIIELRRQRSKEKIAAVLRQKEQRELREMEECLFKPKINAISKKVTDQMWKNIDEGGRFDQLYEEHHAIESKKQAEREKLAKSNAFRPKIDTISQAIIESKRRQGTLSRSLTKKHPCTQSQQRLNRNPKTGRKPISRNIQKLPIGEYLYNQSKRQKLRPVESSNQVKALQHSDYLVSILKEKRIHQIFTELTQPPHDLLTVDDIGYRKFHEGPYRHFKPIFNEMIEMGVELTREEFMETSLMLLKTLSPEEKHEVILKKDKEPLNFSSSQSMVNSRSRQILKRSGCYYHGDIYARGLEQKQRAEWRAEQGKERRVREELSQCTFRPALKRVL